MAIGGLFVGVTGGLGLRLMGGASAGIQCDSGNLGPATVNTTIVTGVTVSSDSMVVSNSGTHTGTVHRVGRCCTSRVRATITRISLNANSTVIQPCASKGRVKLGVVNGSGFVVARGVNACVGNMVVGLSRCRGGGGACHLFRSRSLGSGISPAIVCVHHFTCRGSGRVSLVGAG